MGVFAFRVVDTDNDCAIVPPVASRDARREYVRGDSE